MLVKKQQDGSLRRNNIMARSENNKPARQNNQFETSPLRCDFLKSEVNIKTSFLDQAEISIPASVRIKSNVDFGDPALTDRSKVHRPSANETDLLSSAQPGKFGGMEASRGIHLLKASTFNTFEAKPATQFTL